MPAGVGSGILKSEISDQCLPEQEGVVQKAGARCQAPAGILPGKTKKGSAAGATEPLISRNEHQAAVFP